MQYGHTTKRTLPIQKCRRLGICRHIGTNRGLFRRKSNILLGEKVGTTHAAYLSAAMVKINLNDLGDRLILEVEGRLAGVFVPELERCWRAALAIRPDRKILVDLKDVTCVDRAGRSLLQSMHCSGVLFLRAGIAIQDILEQIMEEKECKQH